MMKLTNRIGPFAPAFEQEVGHLFYLLSQCPRLLGDLYYQPPACTDEITKEEIDAELVEFNERAEDADYALELIAKEIFVGLTGKKVIESKKIEK